MPASPPVRSPARWGSMAWSPLLGGPRAGGVGLLVLLLLGLLRPPPAFCARPVKVRHRSGTGWGWAGGCCGRGSVLSCRPLVLAGPHLRPDMRGDRPGWPGAPRLSAPRPCGTRSLGVRGLAGSHALCTLGPWRGPGLAPPVPCGAVHGTSAREGKGCTHRSLCTRCDDWGVRMRWPCKCVSFGVSASERAADVGLGVQCV